MNSIKYCIAAMSRHFVEGNLTAVIRGFDLPVAIYADDKLIVCDSIDRLVEVLSQFNLLLRKNRVRSVDVEFMALPMRRGTTGTIWVGKTYRDADGDVVDSCRMKIFFREIHGQFRICMVEYIELPFADAIRDLEVFRAA